MYCTLIFFSEPVVLHKDLQTHTGYLPVRRCTTIYVGSALPAQRNGRFYNTCVFFFFSFFHRDVYGNENYFYSTRIVHAYRTGKKYTTASVHIIYTGRSEGAIISACGQ